MIRSCFALILIAMTASLLAACRQPESQAASQQPTITATAQAKAKTVAPTAQPTATSIQKSSLPTTTPTAASTAVIAEQAATATPSPIAATDQLTVPVRVMITRGAETLIDTDIVPGGVILSGGHRIPWTDDHKATWYSGYCGIGPAYSCRVFISGHRLKWKKAPTIPAPFGKLPKVQVGDTLTIFTADGKSESFPVTLSTGVSADDAGKFVGRSKGHPVITLMTCAGDFTQQDGTTIASDRWVVEA